VWNENRITKYRCMKIEMFPQEWIFSLITMFNFADQIQFRTKKEIRV